MAKNYPLTTNVEEYHFCTRGNRNIDGLDLWEAKSTKIKGVVHPLISSIAWSNY